MPRRGTTLIEVLIAIFIMALGLVAIATLFPVGAIQMARSIQDERAAQVAANAASMARMYWRDMCERDVPVGGVPMMAGSPSSLGWFTGAMDDPNAGVPAAFQRTATVFPAVATSPVMSASNMVQMARKTTPSYPVFVDPVGWEAGKGSKDQYWMATDWRSTGTAPTYAVPRRSLPGMEATSNVPQVRRMFFSLDDMNFNTNGSANVGGTFQWQGHYSSAWLLRRDQNNKRSDVNLTVVVYYKRPAAALSEEPVYAGTVNATALPNGSQRFGDTVVLSYAGAKPAIRRGTWIFDTTMDATRPQGYFYRVVEVMEDTGSTMTVQLENSIRPGPGTRTFCIPADVLEVFDKGPIDVNSPARVN